MATLFTSDTHFGHRNIIRYCKRPFLHTQEGGWGDDNLDTKGMDRAMIDNWNKRVQPGDLVYHLGDFAFGSNLGARVRELKEQLNGEIILVVGNHDRRPGTYWGAGIKTAAWVDTIVDGHSIFMSHKPILRPSHRIALCGHVHEAWRTRGNIINVGVDQWDFTPHTLDELLKGCGISL